MHPKLTIQETLKMPDAVFNVCRAFIAKNPNIERMAMQSGGYDATINETWITLSKRKKPFPELHWTTIWCGGIRWALLTLYQKRKLQKLPFVSLSETDREYSDPGPDKAHLDELSERVNSVLKTLTYRERETLRLRFGLIDGYNYTLQQVSKILTTTREQVRRIENKGLSKLSRTPRKSQLINFLEPNHIKEYDTLTQILNNTQNPEDFLITPEDFH